MRYFIVVLFCIVGIGFAHGQNLDSTDIQLLQGDRQAKLLDIQTQQTDIGLDNADMNSREDKIAQDEFVINKEQNTITQWYAIQDAQSNNSVGNVVDNSTGNSMDTQGTLQTITGN